MKKIFSLILSIIMIISVPFGLIITANAETTTSGTCNENLSWQYDPSTKAMTISGKGSLDFDITEPMSTAWKNTVDNNDIEKMIIKDGITYVNFTSFSDCRNIKEIELGKDVKYFTFFEYNDPFRYLKEINIDSDNPYIISVDGVVYNKNKTMLICYPCGRKATEYTIADGIKSIEPSCFSYCINLEKISIPNSVKTIGYNAFGDSSIIELVIPDSVNLIEDYAFSNCKKLKKVKIGNGVSEITDFSGCDDLESIELGNNIEYISGNFNESLKTIIIPKSLKKINSNTFRNCFNLQNVYYSGNESDWDKIQIGSGNNGLYFANIKYNYLPSEQPDTVPTPGDDSGNTGGSTGGGGGVAPAPTPDDTTKKDEEQKPDTTLTQPATSSNITEKPATVKINKSQAKKKAVVVTWNPVSNTDGYQIQVATDKKFKKNKKTVTVTKQNASKKTVKKLKAEKKYYVRVRTYKVVNGKKVYGKWSKIKSAKTK
ncbi:MAG: fibronectin type III domain-containing protein [Clostridia bacterium]|nr:fibronectin type III domain-containing protein [Clostridia bacterium]